MRGGMRILPRRVSGRSDYAALFCLAHARRQFFVAHKQTGDPTEVHMPAKFLALIVTSVSLNALAQVALRKLMLAVGSLPAHPGALLGYVISICFNPWFLAGMSCYALSIGLWLLVLARSK